LAHASGARAHPGQVENGEPFERARTLWNRHFLAPAEAYCAPAAAPGGLTFPDIPGLVYRGEPAPNYLVLPHFWWAVGALNCRPQELRHRISRRSFGLQAQLWRQR